MRAADRRQDSKARKANKHRLGPLGPSPHSSSVAPQALQLQLPATIAEMGLRQTRRGWEEPRPSHCPECGAELGAHQVLVGIAHCSCGRMHRSHCCRAETIYRPPLGDNCRLTHLDERSSRDRNSFCCSRLSEFRGQPHGRHLGHAAPWRGNLHRELPGRSPHEMGIHPRGAANSQSSKAAPRAPIARIILSTRRGMTRCAQRGSFPRRNTCPTATSALSPVPRLIPRPSGSVCSATTWPAPGTGDGTSVSLNSNVAAALPGFAQRALAGPPLRHPDRAAEGPRPRRRPRLGPAGQPAGDRLAVHQSRRPAGDRRLMLRTPVRAIGSSHLSVRSTSRSNFHCWHARPSDSGGRYDPRHFAKRCIDCLRFFETTIQPVTIFSPGWPRKSEDRSRIAQTYRYSGATRSVRCSRHAVDSRR